MAVVLALAAGAATYRWKLEDALRRTAASVGTGYFVYLGIGSLIGAYLFGTLNLYLSGVPQIGRSILGALFGAIVMVEVYKARRGMTGSTGYIYAIPFCICVAVGRVGCFLSGLPDHTYGTPTNLPWGWDFGDGVLRHPVQLYESLSMLAFGLCLIALLRWRREIMVAFGFYLCVGFYAAQRFVWEFFKPYGDLIPPLNVFQLLCLILLIYSAFMIGKSRHVRLPA